MSQCSDFRKVIEYSWLVLMVGNILFALVGLADAAIDAWRNRGKSPAELEAEHQRRKGELFEEALQHQREDQRRFWR